MSRFIRLLCLTTLVATMLSCADAGTLRDKRSVSVDASNEGGDVSNENEGGDVTNENEGGDNVSKESNNQGRKRRSAESVSVTCSLNKSECNILKFLGINSVICRLLRSSVVTLLFRA